MTNDIITTNNGQLEIILRLSAEELLSLKSSLFYASLMSDNLTNKRNDIQSNLDNGTYRDKTTSEIKQREINSLNRLILNFEKNSDLIKKFFEFF